MSIKRSKAILGFFSVLIMMHHLALKTSAANVPSAYRQPGLGVFVSIGYFLVAFFFFCSGYGLIRSIRTKENYMDGFLIRRLNRILLVFVLTELVYLLVRFAFSATAFSLNPYSWFVYTIVILYIGFFLVYRKNKRCNLCLMALWILAYCVICHVLVLGNWWINSVPVFLLGIILADHEEAFLKKLRGPKILGYAVLAVTLLICFVVSENADSIGRFWGIPAYGIINFFLLVFQILAGSAFSLIIYAAVLLHKKTEEQKKIPGIVNRILLFYGGMTLEFYLIHGLFVNLFSYCFFLDTIPAVCYIRNIFLYVVVVFGLSTVSAYLLKKCADLIVEGYKHSEIFRRFCAGAKKTALILFALFIIFTAAYSIYRHSLSDDAGVKLEEYRNENIRVVDTKAGKVATYCTGEGRYTLVFLGGDFDACPTLSLRVLTDRLQDRYRCVIIDYPGKGFSPDTDAERTADYFADLIHETLAAIGEEQNIVLVADQISALYSYRYMEKYPENVSGFVGITPYVPELALRFLGGDVRSVDEYKWYLNRVIALEGFRQKTMNFTGLSGLQISSVHDLFYGSGLKEYYPIMDEMFVRNYLQDAHKKELTQVYENCKISEGFQLPHNLPALLFMDYTAKTTKPYGINWQDAYDRMITNDKIQTVEIINGDEYAIYYRSGVIAEKIGELF